MTHADGTEWWRGAVIYQIYPRSFLDTTGNGVGDLNGIIGKLDHVASLGVDGIWISPFFTSPMKDYGYDVADYCDVDPVFGTLDDFDRLVERAHALGLKVIIDQVYAHTSDQHDWFLESRSSRDNPKADWYVWADAKADGSPPSNWQSVFGGPAWTWDAGRQQYYMHNFLREQPQLNLHEAEVQDALLAAARFWLERGVDGFRLDAINFAMHDPALTDNPPSGLALEKVTRPFDMQLHIHNQSQPQIAGFLERVRALTDEYGTCFTVAEVVGADPIGEMRLFTEGEARLNTAYNFDFLYAERLTPERVRQSLTQWPGEPGEGWPSWAFSNHDTPRAISRWAPPEREGDTAGVLALLLLALRGNIFLYQGEELALPQADIPFERLLDPEAIANWPRTLGRDGARSPMPWKSGEVNAGFSSGDPWLPLDKRHAALAVDAQEDDPETCLNITRALIALRAKLPVLRLGALEFLDTDEEGILAFRRHLGAEEVLCVFNLGDKNAMPVLPGSYRMLASEKGLAEGEAVMPETLAPWSGYWAVPR